MTDTGCSSAYSVSAWQASDTSVVGLVTILAYPSSACYVTFAVLGALAQVALLPQSPPPPPALQIRSGPNGGGTTVTGTRTAVVGQFFDLFGFVTNWSGGESFQWTLPGDGNVVPESGWTANVGVGPQRRFTTVPGP